MLPINITIGFKAARTTPGGFFAPIFKEENKMKKITAIILTLILTLSMTACGSGAPAPDTPAEAPADSGEKIFNVGICQLAQHPALDAATQGFTDALKEGLGDRVNISLQNASGDSATCSVICNQFVSDDVDLIMANATASLQAAVSATGDIPVLGTSITDYGTALGEENWTGVSGKNISGTSDLAPLDGQAGIINELFPDAKTVGILYCSGEPNSLFQVQTITPMLTDMGYEVKEFSFSDSNDVSSVTATACEECDVLYIPTDNTAASCGEAINNVALNAGVPIICGEELVCAVFGTATLSISYYDIGFETGKMACEILLNGADISQMEIRYSPKFEKVYNPDICEALNVSVPDDFTAVNVD